MLPSVDWPQTGSYCIVQASGRGSAQAANPIPMSACSVRLGDFAHPAIVATQAAITVKMAMFCFKKLLPGSRTVSSPPCRLV